MPKPVFLMTVQEAHKEYNSLTDQIRAKYKQLDSCEYGAVGTPAFDAEACELANLPGVSGSYTTPYTEYYEVWKLYSTLHTVASHPSKGKGI